MQDEYLFQRYGVHVLWYPFSPDDRKKHASPPDPATWNTLFYRALDDIHAHWKEWQMAWCRKAKFRRVSIPARSDRFLHYEFRADKPLGQERLDADIGKLRRDLEDKGTRVIVLMGPGGCGKSLRAIELLKRMPEGFFWSSYYSGDWLTGVDWAIEWLNRKQQIPSGGRSRLARLQELMCSAGTGRRSDTRTVLVFDGFERLLQETEESDVGKTYSASVHAFLDTIAHPDSQVTVILTSRLWPKEYGSLLAAGDRCPIATEAQAEQKVREGVKLVQVFPFMANDLFAPESPPFGSLGPEKTTLLCSLLDGHAFGLRIAQKFLIHSEDERDAFKRLELALQRTPPHGRVSRMVREAIEGFKLKHKQEFKAKVIDGFLGRLAVFMSPVGAAPLEICLKQAIAKAGESPNGREAADCLNLIRKLSNVAIAMDVRDPTSDEECWTLHPVVRSYVFHRLHGARSGDLPNFTLSGYTSGTKAVYPGSDHAADLVVAVIHALLDGATDKNRKHLDRRYLCRAAVGVMRSRMESTAAARWCRYDDYIRLSVEVLNVVKQVSIDGCGIWNRADALRTKSSRNDVFEVDDKDGVLYPEELAWLYNDLGLACCCEGAMHDAYAVWEEGYEINKLIEKGEQSGQFVVQSRLHLAHTFMELGDLETAEQYLVQTEQANFWLKSKDYAGRILGYKALLEHLRGNVARAEDHYKQALRMLRRGVGNPRAESKFLQHRADLSIHRKDWQAAEEDIRVSRAIAEEGDHPDLVAFARNSLGHWYRSRKEFNDARHEYEAALNRARKGGIRRLESDVLSELSRLALDQGDPETARLRAMESMRIANELGLGLRQCHGLVVLGLASIMADQRDLGIAYLRVAYKLSRDSGYWLRAQEADEALRKLGEEPEETSKDLCGNVSSI